MAESDRSSLTGPILQAVLEKWREAGEKHLIPITGRSMLPFIREGDRALVAHGCQGIRPGDVIVFRQGESLIAHRVIRLLADHTFLTRGDNAEQFDAPVPGEAVLGRVLAIQRGAQVMRLHTTAWSITGRLIVMGTLAGGQLYRWVRPLKRWLVGPNPNRLTLFARRQALNVIRLGLKLLQYLACRWQG